MYRLNGKQVHLEYREYQFSSEFPLFTLLFGEYCFPKPQTELNFMHFHNCVEIGICRSGRQILHVEEQVMEMRPGDICIIPPYTMHITRALPHWEETILCEYLYFLPDTILGGIGIHSCPQALRWYTTMGTGCIFHKEEKELQQAVNGILDEMREKDGFSKYTIYGYLQMLFVLLSRIQVSHGNGGEATYYERERLFPAISHINKNFSDPIRMSDLAILCGMNEGFFRRLFIKQMGRTPNAYLRFVRLQHACELLAHTEKRIIDVAMESGFLSVSNFNQCFLEQYHQSPRQWRNKARAIKKVNLNHTTYRHGDGGNNEKRENLKRWEG